VKPLARIKAYISFTPSSECQKSNMDTKVKEIRGGRGDRSIGRNCDKVFLPTKRLTFLQGCCARETRREWHESQYIADAFKNSRTPFDSSLQLEQVVGLEPVAYNFFQL
jgi:hypothetical protein